MIMTLANWYQNVRLKEFLEDKLAEAAKYDTNFRNHLEDEILLAQYQIDWAKERLMHWTVAISIGLIGYVVYIIIKG